MSESYSERKRKQVEQVIKEILKDEKENPYTDSELVEVIWQRYRIATQPCYLALRRKFMGIPKKRKGQ